MKLTFVLDEMRRMAKDDGTLNHDVHILTVLDYLATMQMDGAQELYMKCLTGKTSKHLR